MGVRMSHPERLTITSVSPSVSAGAYPSKRVQHDIVEISATVVCDSAFVLGAQLRLTQPDDVRTTIALTRDTGYTFSAEVELDQLGLYAFEIDAWIDRAETMR